MKPKFFGISMIGLAIVLSIIGVMVTSEPAKAAETVPTIAVMLPNGGDPYFQAKWYGYESEAKKLGVNMIFFDAGGYAFTSKQIAQVEDVIQRKVDGIIFTATNSTATVPVVERAIKAGIHVVNDNVPVKTDMIKARVMKNDYEIGMLQASALVDMMEGKGKFMVLAGPAGSETHVARVQGVKDVCSQFKDVKIVDIKWLEQSSAVAMKNMEDVLQTHSDLRAVYSPGGLQAQGAIQAMKAAGYKPGQILVGQCDMLPYQAKMVEEGWAAVLVPNPAVTMARDAVRVCLDMIKGRPYPAMTYSRAVMVTKKTLPSYDWSGNTVPEGWKASMSVTVGK